MEVRLLKMPFLSVNYDNVIDFRYESSRNKYFDSKPQEKREANTKVGSALTSLTVNASLDEVSEFDYLYLYYKNKPYYYFIMEHEMINERNTMLILEKDVFTTHQFDVNYHDSFIDRCHVKRWESDGTPTRNTVEESLDYGELILTDNEEIKDFSDTIVMASSVPMGILQPTNPSFPSVGGGGNPSDGVISKNGYIYIKQEEAFAPYPFDVEGNGMNTGGYGTHSKYQSNYYRQLAPFPTTERKASEVLDTMVTTEFAKPVRDLIQDNGINPATVPSPCFDVWVSIALNYGYTGLQRREAWKYFLKNPDDRDGIADLIAQESANPNRRKREAKIYRTGNYPPESEKNIGEYNSSGQLVGSVDFPGYIPPRYEGQIEVGAGGTIQLKIIQSGRKLIGKPYIWGGNYPPLGKSSGTDCSGFCEWAYNDNGLGGGKIIPHRWTTVTMKNYGRSVKQADIQIADCIFTPGHVVLYAGVKDGRHRILEAPNRKNPIRERNFTFDNSIIDIRRYI